jgi:hypothetical protein
MGMDETGVYDGMGVKKLRPIVLTDAAANLQFPVAFDRLRFRSHSGNAEDPCEDQLRIVAKPKPVWVFGQGDRGASAGGRGTLSSPSPSANSVGT